MQTGLYTFGDTGINAASGLTVAPSQQLRAIELLGTRVVLEVRRALSLARI